MCFVTQLKKQFAGMLKMGRVLRFQKDLTAVVSGETERGQTNREEMRSDV